MYELKIKAQIVNDRKTGMSYGVIGKKYGYNPRRPTARIL